MLPVDEAIRLSGLTRTGLFNALAAGLITSRKSGRRTLVETESLRSHLASLPVTKYGKSRRVAAKAGRRAVENSSSTQARSDASLPSRVRIDLDKVSFSGPLYGAQLVRDTRTDEVVIEVLVPRAPALGLA